MRMRRRTTAPSKKPAKAPAMTKTQVYLPTDELAALHRVARQHHRRVADLIREAIRDKWLRAAPSGPVALWDGPFSGSSADHDSAFDDVS